MGDVINFEQRLQLAGMKLSHFKVFYDAMPVEKDARFSSQRTNLENKLAQLADDPGFEENEYQFHLIMDDAIDTMLGWDNKVANYITSSNDLLQDLKDERSVGDLQYLMDTLLSRISDGLQDRQPYPYSPTEAELEEFRKDIVRVLPDENSEKNIFEDIGHAAGGLRDYVKDIWDSNYPSIKDFFSKNYKHAKNLFHLGTTLKEIAADAKKVSEAVERIEPLITDTLEIVNDTAKKVKKLYEKLEELVDSLPELLSYKEDLSVMKTAYSRAQCLGSQIKRLFSKDAQGEYFINDPQRFYTYVDQLEQELTVISARGGLFEQMSLLLPQFTTWMVNFELMETHKETNQAFYERRPIEESPLFSNFKHTYSRVLTEGRDHAANAAEVLKRKFAEGNMGISVVRIEPADDLKEIARYRSCRVHGWDDPDGQPLFYDPTNTDAFLGDFFHDPFILKPVSLGYDGEIPRLELVTLAIEDEDLESYQPVMGLTSSDSHPSISDAIEFLDAAVHSGKYVEIDSASFIPPRGRLALKYFEEEVRPLMERQFRIMAYMDFIIANKEELVDLFNLKEDGSYR